MKFSASALALVMLGASTSSAFVPATNMAAATKKASTTTSLEASKNGFAGAAAGAFAGLTLAAQVAFASTISGTPPPQGTLMHSS